MSLIDGDLTLGEYHRHFLLVKPQKQTTKTNRKTLQLLSLTVVNLHKMFQNIPNLISLLAK